MLNCKQVSYLLSKKRDTALTQDEQQQLDEHLSECPPCKRLGEQMRDLGQLLKTFMTRKPK